MRLALGERAGEEFDPVSDAGQGPTMLVFVHEVTRPSAAVARTIVNYARRFHDRGLRTSVVFLTADPTETETWMRRARHALPQEVPLGISVDGLEGPGAYGLNRKVSLTVLLANEQRVTANFALVQPSLAVDAPRIGAAIEKLVGNDRQPTLAEMGVIATPEMREADDGSFRRLLAPVIRRTAGPDEVDAAAKAVEAHAEKDPAFRKQLGETTRRIVDAGVLENYGTPPARKYLQKWADEFGGAAEPADESRPESSPPPPPGTTDRP
jgi:hypothetical protein